MNAPMVGTWTVVVKAVAPFSFHGDLYYDLHVVRTDDPAAAGEPAGPVLSLRVPRHAMPREPQAGERLSVSFLMGQVTSASPL